MTKYIIAQLRREQGHGLAGIQLKLGDHCAVALSDGGQLVVLLEDMEPLVMDLKAPTHAWRAYIEFMKSDDTTFNFTRFDRLGEQ